MDDCLLSHSQRWRGCVSVPEKPSEGAATICDLLHEHFFGFLVRGWPCGSVPDVIHSVWEEGLQICPISGISAPELCVAARPLMLEVHSRVTERTRDKVSVEHDRSDFDGLSVRL